MAKASSYLEPCYEHCIVVIVESFCAVNVQAQGALRQNFNISIAFRPIVNSIVTFDFTVRVVTLVGVFINLCSHIWLPSHSLHCDLIRPCSHTWLPSHFLHIDLCRLCSHIWLPPHSLHCCFCRPCSHFLEGMIRS